MFSMTVRCPNRLKDWNTMPIFLRISLRSQLPSLMTCPSTIISPEVGGSSMLMHRKRVDLPVPEGPITEITSPELMVTLTSSKGVMSSYSFLKCLSSIILSIVLLPCRLMLSESEHHKKPRVNLSCIQLPICSLISSSIQQNSTFRNEKFEYAF